MMRAVNKQLSTNINALKVEPLRVNVFNKNRDGVRLLTEHL